MYALRHQIGSQFSAVEYVRDRAALCNTVAPASALLSGSGAHQNFVTTFNGNKLTFGFRYVAGKHCFLSLLKTLFFLIFPIFIIFVLNCLITIENKMNE